MRLRNILLSIFACMIVAKPFAAELTNQEKDAIAIANEKQEAISEQLAPIQTRADLIRFLADKDESNPLNKLSSMARERLLSTLIVNQEGRISSYYLADIKAELTPSESYKVLALFGQQRAAVRQNNGITKTNLDAAIVDSDAKSIKRVHTDDQGYYCNGGYCTANTAMMCIPSGCHLP